MDVMDKVILIVDDDPVNIQILVEVLKPHYKCLVALDSDKALSIAHSKNIPDLILLDIIMPGISGYELCEKLKSDKRTKDIPVIFVTSKADEEGEKKGFELGAVDYITKPLSPALVKARVETHLDLKTAREALMHQNVLLEEQVSERTRELKEKNDRLVTVLEEKNVLIREVHHRVRNNLQFISNILMLQADKSDDENFMCMLKDYTNRLLSVAFVHNMLYEAETYIDVDFVEYSRKLMSHLIKSYDIPSRNIDLIINVEDFKIDLNYAIPCGLILNELISNSLKFAFLKDEKGKIMITLKLDGNADYYITVRDDGIGLPADFDFNSSDTFGMNIIQSLTQQIGGTANLKTNKGTEFILKFRKQTLSTYGFYNP
jgi:two-component sensor histidine kinase